MNIRQATLDDAKILAQLNGHVQHVHANALPNIYKPAIVDKHLISVYAERINSNEVGIYIAEVAGQPVGYIYSLVHRSPGNSFKYERDVLLVDEMSVNPEYYGSGVADRLMEAVKDFAKHHQISRIMLTVLDFNQRAQRFYEKQGFTSYSHRMQLVLE